VSILLAQCWFQELGIANAIFRITGTTVVYWALLVTNGAQ